jgi:hypothetical protein
LRSFFVSFLERLLSRCVAGLNVGGVKGLGRDVLKKMKKMYVVNQKEAEFEMLFLQNFQLTKSVRRK